MTPPEPADASEADRVVLSYSGQPDDWIGRELATEVYVGYLRKRHAGPLQAGATWEEFVSRGCGSPADVELRVESVEGGSRVGPNTAFEFVARERTDAL